MKKSASYTVRRKPPLQSMERKKKTKESNEGSERDGVLSNVVGEVGVLQEHITNEPDVSAVDISACDARNAVVAILASRCKGHVTGIDGE